MLPKPSTLMKKILEQIDVIELLTIELTSGNAFFGRYPTVQLPRFTSPELGMIRTISWFYVMYNELGKANIKYIIDKFDAFDLDSDDKNKLHFINIHRLRTFFQHDLDLTTEPDRKTKNHCDQFFTIYCGISYPQRSTHWNVSLLSILTEAEHFLMSVYRCIQAIENDESKELLIKEWKYRQRRHHPQHEFDRIIQIVAADIGRENINSKKFSTEHYSNWLNELKNKDDNYNFEVEARKLIERDLISYTKPDIGITGTDIMKKFSLSPGPKIGELLTKAFEIFATDFCSKEILLERLRDYI